MIGNPDRAPGSTPSPSMIDDHPISWQMNGGFEDSQYIVRDGRNLAADLPKANWGGNGGFPLLRLRFRTVGTVPIAVVPLTSKLRPLLGAVWPGGGDW